MTEDTSKGTGSICVHGLHLFLGYCLALDRVRDAYCTERYFVPEHTNIYNSVRRKMWFF